MSGPNYDELPVHRLMLRDKVRNETYQKAIAETVKEGDVVLDVGAGTGILSLFAAQAGARKVYAVERTRMAEMARTVIKDNGMEDCVEVIQAEVEALELSEKVDVIISEWMGGYGTDEYMHIPVLVACGRWLKEGGKILPERVTAWMGPVWDCELDEDMNFWRSRPYRIDLGAIADSTAREVYWVQHHITEDTLLAQPQVMWSVDLYQCSLEQARGPFSTTLSFSARRKGKLCALAAWFRAEFGEEIVLTNAPDAPKTHWGRWVFPLERTVEINEGTEIAVEFTCESDGSAYCHNRWLVRVGDGPWEHHDTRKQF
jgi:SAM-dependent methyltransferase